MEQNFDDYPDFQPKITHPKHVSLQCNKSDGAILASRKIAPDREQRSESNFPSNWWSSRLRKWKLSHFTTMELCHCHGCIFLCHTLAHATVCRHRAASSLRPLSLQRTKNIAKNSYLVFLLIPHSIILNKTIILTDNQKHVKWEKIPSSKIWSI